jgi:hypothetical protein
MTRTRSTWLPVEFEHVTTEFSLLRRRVNA